MREKRFGVDKVRTALIERVNAHGVRSVARDLKFDPAVVSKVANGLLDISDNLARALGFDPCPREYTRSK